MQCHVITTAVQSADHRRQLRVAVGDHAMIAEDWLAAAIEEKVPPASPDVLEAYSLKSYQNKITDLYAGLLQPSDSVIQHVPPEKVLADQFRPLDFHFLRSTPNPCRPNIRALVFDLYGTLLVAPAGGVKPDPQADPLLTAILNRFGFSASASPSTDLHAAMLRHHAAAKVPHPEIDLRVLWWEILGASPDLDLEPLVLAIEETWHPSAPMPGAWEVIRQLAASRLPLGLLSNAQANSLGSLGPIAPLFAADLTVLSYQHGIAKPSPELFSLLVERLAARGIGPAETLFVGNDPLQDIVPASSAGFLTAQFVGHPESLRPGNANPDFIFSEWSRLLDLIPP
jgi:putative hydrolase of the HAD superfamily